MNNLLNESQTDLHNPDLDYDYIKFRSMDQNNSEKYAFLLDPATICKYSKRTVVIQIIS